MSQANAVIKRSLDNFQRSCAADRHSIAGDDLINSEAPQLSLTLQLLTSAVEVQLLICMWIALSSVARQITHLAHAPSTVQTVSAKATAFQAQICNRSAISGTCSQQRSVSRGVSRLSSAQTRCVTYASICSPAPAQHAVGVPSITLTGSQIMTVAGSMVARAASRWQLPGMADGGGNGTPLADVETALNGIAPTQHAASWDNVGLLVGVPQQLIRWHSAHSRSDAMLVMTAGHDGTMLVMTADHDGTKSSASSISCIKLNKKASAHWPSQPLALLSATLQLHAGHD